MQRIDFINFLELLDLIKIEDEIKVSSAFVQTKEADKITFKPLLHAFPNLLDKLPKAIASFKERAKQFREQVRFATACFKDTYSLETFEWTKCALRIDIDLLLSLEQVKEYCQKLPIKPNIILRTVKGWHIFYLTSNTITKDNVPLFEPILNEFKNIIKANYSSLNGDKVVDNVHILWQIFTRYSEEVYLLETPYEKERLFILINSLSSEDVLQIENNQIKVKASYIPISHLTPQTFQTICETCHILRTLEERWADHTYHEWFIMAWKYSVLAHLTQDIETYKNEFLTKSKLYVKETVSEERIKKAFDYVFKWVRTNGGLKYFSCQWLHLNTRFSDLCYSCKIAKWYDGRLISSVIRDLLSIKVEGYELDERTGAWYVYKDNTRQYVCEFFVIDDYVYFAKPEVKTNFLKVITADGVVYIPLEYTSGGNIDYSNITDIAFDPTMRKEFKTLMEKLVSQFQNKYGRRTIRIVGYYYDEEEKKWRFVIANKEGFRVEDMTFFMYGLMEKITRKFIPSTKGSLEKWKQIYRQLFEISDPVMLLLIGYFLTHVLKPYLRNTNLEEEFNTIMFLRGSSGTGKTTRLRLATALYSAPATLNITETTFTRIEREFGNYKLPLPLDEIQGGKEERIELIKNLVYLIAEEGTKAHSYAVFEPINVPVVLSGEPQNLPIEELLTGNEGLFRRSLVVLLDNEKVKEYDKFMSFYTKLIRELRENHGFAYDFIKFLEERAQEIKIKAENLADWKPLQEVFSERGYAEVKVRLLSALDNLLCRIFFSLYLFSQYLEVPKEVWDRAFDNLYLYITNYVASFYELFLPRERKLDEELYEFILKLTDAMYKLSRDEKDMKSEKTFYGKTLDSLIKITKVKTPSSRILKLAKYVLLKRYKTHGAFVYINSLLVKRYALGDGQTLSDIVRLLENIKELPKEEAEACLKAYFTTLKAVLSSGSFNDIKEAVWKEFGLNIDDYIIFKDENTERNPEPPEGNIFKNVEKKNEEKQLNTELLDEDLLKHFIGEDIGKETGTAVIVKTKTKIQPILVNKLTEIPANYKEPLYFDIEATNENKPVLLSLYQESWKEKVYILDLRKLSLEQVKEFLLRFGKLCGWGLNYDLTVLGFTYQELKDKNIEDILLLARYSFYERFKRNGFGLGDFIKEVLGINYNFDKEKIRKSFTSMIFTSEQLLYTAYDVFYLPEICRKCLEKKQPNLVYELDKEALKVCIDASQIGMPFKVEEAKNLLKQIKSELNVIRNRLSFNPNSSQEVVKYLNVENAQRETLQALLLQTTDEKKKGLIADVLTYKELDKRRSLIENYLRYGNRVKGIFWTTTAPSGRMSCNDENLQQIPRNLRHLFGFETEDKKLIVADFPQIELRLAGAIWNEPKFIEAFRNNTDLHKLTASIIYNKPLEEITKEERQVAKSANFGLIYGMSLDGFIKYCQGNGIRIELSFAESVIKNFFGYYTKIYEQHEIVKRAFKTNSEHEGETWLGRTYLATSPQDILNYQIQGSGAELFKKTIIELKRKYPDLRIVNLVHDEIVIEADIKDVQDVANMVKATMSEAWDWCIEKARENGYKVEYFLLNPEEPNISNVWEKV